jgi:hypothetical protein
LNTSLVSVAASGSTSTLPSMKRRILGNYAKLIIIWNPLDNLPISANNHLRAGNLQNLFVVNSTSTNSSSTSK